MERQLNFRCRFVSMGRRFSGMFGKRLQTIPFGATWSYSELAQRVGNAERVVPLVVLIVVTRLLFWCRAIVWLARWYALWLCW